jgi:tetratricopeptide (TPR) repeat protein
MKPKLFIGSSVEGLPIGYAIQKNLRRVAEVTIWDQGVFLLSATTLESLLSAAPRFDFAAFVFSPDDVTKIRQEEHSTVRDNVVFELGLFVGRLCRERCFVFVPENTQLHVPTDLIGLTPATYEADRSDNNFVAGCGAACHDVAEQITKLGPFLVADYVSEGGSPKIALKREDIVSSQVEAPPKVGGELERESNDWITPVFEKDFVRAKMIVQKMAEEATTESARLDARIFEAVIDFESGDPTAAAHFEQLISDNPGSRDVYSWFGNCYKWDRLYDKALEVFDRGLAAATDKVELNLAKAQTLVSLGKKSDSAALLERAIQDHPQAESLYSALSASERAENRKEKAHNVLLAGIEVLPKSEQLLSELASLAYERADYAGTVTVYNRLLFIDDKNATYHTLKGNALLELELFSLALAEYNRANELSEGKAAWILGNIGNLLNHRGLSIQAIDKLKESLKIDPSSEYSHNRLALAMASKAAERKRLENLLASARPVFSKLPISELQRPVIPASILEALLPPSNS